jgi:hypothetical protein
MSGKRFWIAILATLTALGVFACAQDEKNQIAGMIGRTFVSDQGIQCGGCINPFIRSGKGLSLEGDYSRWLLGNPLFSISGEIPVVYNFDQDLNSGVNVVPTGYSTFFVTPAARLNLFPSTAISPWVSLGGGMGRFGENQNLLYGGKNPGKSNFTGVLQGGIGLDVRIWRRFSLRGEARDFWSGEPSFPLATGEKTRQHNFFVGAGVVWRY